MRIDIVTIFPEMFVPLECSIIGRARRAGKVELYIHNLRDYTTDSHKTVDDMPYGGGAGMVMKIEPLYKAVQHIKSLCRQNPKVILLSPQGKVLTQGVCEHLSRIDGMLLVCAHYEGVDERFVRHVCDEEISIGDYILTGGELPAMILADSVIRLIPTVIDSESVAQESFAQGLLDYPHYTRPADFNGWKVPEVLCSGNHAKIAQWRSLQRIENTFIKRPELLETAILSKPQAVYYDALTHKVEENLP